MFVFFFEGKVFLCGSSLDKEPAINLPSGRGKFSLTFYQVEDG